MKVRKAKNRRAEILGTIIRAQPQKGLSPEKLRHILEDLGPVYVKLGQMMAVSSSLIPEAYRAELGKLRSSVTPMDIVTVHEVLNREFNGESQKVFYSFSDKPEGSASVAQVHKAVLMTGETVAVKVLRPESLELMACDIRILRSLGKNLLLRPVREVVNFDMLLDELWSAAQSELDLRAEAQNMERFTNGNPLSRCPDIYNGLCTKNVLVMEFIDGILLDDPCVVEKTGCDAESLIEKLALDYARQVFSSGIFHADPHPGNICIQDGQIVWLDLGLTGEISHSHRRFFAQGLKAIVFDDCAQLARILVDMGTCSNHTNQEKLAADIEPLLRDFKAGELANADLPKLTAQFLSLARRHGIVMPENVTLLTRSVLALAGLIQTLNPDFDILSVGPEIIAISNQVME